MADGTACLCLGNSHVVELCEVVHHGRCSLNLCRWSTLRWIKSQIWTVLTAARELWVLVAGVSANDSQTWIVAWLHQLVLHTSSRLNFCALWLELGLLFVHHFVGFGCFGRVCSPGFWACSTVPPQPASGCVLRLAPG